MPELTAQERLPRLRLDLAALEHNVGLMARWCADRSVALSPHIKTTMTRPIVERQLTAGAWGVTVATVRQAAIARDWGIDRILIANQVVLPGDLAEIRGWLEEPGFDLAFLVDSVAGVRLAEAAMRDAARPAPMLIDVGTPGGRTGVRTRGSATELATLVAAAPGLALAGVSAYEGVVPNSRDPENLALVDDHCVRAVETFVGVAQWAEISEPVLTMGGSAFPDRVAEAFASRSGLESAHLVLRSGCYVTHDHGTYAGVTPIPDLCPALSVRTVVLSVPERGLAVLGAGKRELPHDAGLPVLLSARTSDGVSREKARGTAARIFDHHLVLEQAHGLEVGDVVDLGISHPCSAFSRWAAIDVVDAQGEVCDVWTPRFGPG